MLSEIRAIEIDLAEQIKEINNCKGKDICILVVLLVKELRVVSLRIHFRTGWFCSEHLIAQSDNALCRFGLQLIHVTHTIYRCTYIKLSRVCCI